MLLVRMSEETCSDCTRELSSGGRNVAGMSMSGREVIPSAGLGEICWVKEGLSERIDEGESWDEVVGVEREEEGGEGEGKTVVLGI